jgi:hypothetical protein
LCHDTFAGKLSVVPLTEWQFGLLPFRFKSHACSSLVTARHFGMLRSGRNFNQTPSEDILVIDGLVWTSPNLTEGRDPKTGKIVKTLDLQETMVTTGDHHRCYRDRGVGSSIIFGHRGMEFFDTQGENHSRNNWVRGVCQWGVNRTQNTRLPHEHF